MTDHYLLDQIYVEHEELRFGPANIICWTLTSDNLLGPVATLNNRLRASAQGPANNATLE